MADEKLEEPEQTPEDAARTEAHNQRANRAYGSLCRRAGRPRPDVARMAEQLALTKLLLAKGVVSRLELTEWTADELEARDAQEQKDALTAGINADVAERIYRGPNGKG